MDTYKFTNAAGSTEYSETPPTKVGTEWKRIHEGQVVDNGTVGRLSTRQAEIKAKTDAEAKVNAEGKAIEEDEHTALARLQQKSAVLTQATTKLNASRTTLFDDIQKTNAGLSTVNATQNGVDFAVAAAAVVATGIVILAASPAIVTVGLVVGTAASVTELVNNELRPDEEKTTLEKAKDHVDDGRTVLEGIQADRDAAEAAEAAKAGKTALGAATGAGKVATSVGSKLLGGAGGALTAGQAIESGFSHDAERLSPSVNSSVGLDMFGQQLDKLEPSFLDRNLGGVNKERLQGELEDTKEAQKEYDKAKKEYDDAARAYKVAMMNAATWVANH